MSRTVRNLKDGYWDQTFVVRCSDGALRVRKQSRNDVEPGPWAHKALREEIEYLRSLPENVQPYFPSLLDSWDDLSIGYDIPFFEDRRDVARLMLANELCPADSQAIQAELAHVILSGLHGEQAEKAPSFTVHLEGTVEESINELTRNLAFQEIVESPQIQINGACPVPGLRAALETVRHSGLLSRLATQPTVRIHGDLILENILWPELILIDPVSVTGISHGPPLFDLVKYESYATGELYAIREGLIKAGPSPDGGYSHEIQWATNELQPFKTLDLHTIFRQEFVRVHGPVDQQLYQLIDAYFSLVMARNTSGTHQFARVLKGAQCLAAASRNLG